MELAINIEIIWDQRQEGDNANACCGGYGDDRNRLSGCVTHIRRTDKCRRDQQRSDRHVAHYQSAVPLALDLRTARMRKDPTLLVKSNQTRELEEGAFEASNAAPDCCRFASRLWKIVFRL